MFDPDQASPRVQQHDLKMFYLIAAILLAQQTRDQFRGIELGFFPVSLTAEAAG